MRWSSSGALDGQLMAMLSLSALAGSAAEYGFWPMFLSTDRGKTISDGGIVCTPRCSGLVPFFGTPASR